MMFVLALAASCESTNINDVLTPSLRVFRDDFDGDHRPPAERRFRLHY